MMQLFFAIYDRKSETFDTPFPAPSIATAERMFHKAVNKDGTDYNLYAADFSLHQVGAFDVGTGRMEGVEPLCITTAVQVHEGERPFIYDTGERNHG